ncbi:batten's disease protein Cln3 [Neoconidiobolus thromboides FSU 785]|nr:batten's disease protein Cln3 [Neoconidiobolus thromboides FSU 785]
MSLTKQAKLDNFCFFINGLINNFVYVVFLSAALDLVGDKLPKASVLIADILPAFLVKLTVPLYMHKVRYHYRITFVILCSIFSLYLVAFSTNLQFQFLGIILASASSGLGEVTFLAMATFYKTNVFHYWASGTGAAGLVGSFIYLAFSTWFQFSTKVTMCLCSILPMLQLLAYFKLLSHPFVNFEMNRNGGFQPLIAGGVNSNEETNNQGIINGVNNNEEAGSNNPVIRAEHYDFKNKVKHVLNLLPEYMIPLFLVFFLEYTINQGLAPNLLFPVEETFFLKLRDHYVYYQFFYQLGVFISRSSSTLFPISQLYYLVFAQFLTFLILLFISLHKIPSNIYLNFFLMSFEGLFGGATYANAFTKLNNELEPHLTEFSMGIASVSDTLGITVAALVSYFLEPIICNYQFSIGILLCKSIAE